MAYDKTTFLSGLAMGLCGKGNPTSNMTATGGTSDNENGLKKGSLVCKSVISIPSNYKGSDTLKVKTWNGLTSFYGNCVWSDGTDIYYSTGSTQYVLNGDTWEPKSWNGLTSFYSDIIWSDGTDIYYSTSSTQYILNGDTWESKTWNGLTSFYGSCVWSDGTDIYYSFFSNQYVLNGDTWEPKSWNGLPSFYGDNIWSDGTHVYYSSATSQYILNGDTWEPKSWNGLTSFSSEYIWSDGTDIYYSNGTTQYVLNGDTWETKTWNDLTSLSGSAVWTDGTNIYCSLNNNQYVLDGTIIQDAFTKGYLTGAELRAKRRLPVAYLYNGTRLPKLPKSDLPYMYIYQSGGSYGYVLVATQKPCKFEKTKAQYGELLPQHSTPLTVSDDGIAVEYTGYAAYENYTEWDLRSENKIMPYGLRISLPIIWSNYDFCYNDGEVYVAASPAPIPVYK